MSDSPKWMLIGAITILIGAIIIGNATVASMAIAVLTGIALLIGGGITVVGGLSVESTGGKIFSIVIGVIMLLLGWSMLAHPLQGVISLSMAVLILIIAGGLTRLYMSFKMRGTQLSMPMLISGILSLVLAAVIWWSFDGEAANMTSLLGILLGIETILNGIGFIVLGLFVRKVDKALA